MSRVSERAVVAAAGVVICVVIAWLLINGSHGAHRPPAEPTGGSRPPAPAGYKLVWADEFNGPRGSRPDPANWRFETGGNGWGNGELEYYTTSPSNGSLDGAGHLAITARRQVYTGSDGVKRDYTSAKLETSELFETKYGLIQARIKLPAGVGLWPAFWALGSDFDQVGWPESGEVDLMENNGDDPFKVYGVLHGPLPGHPRGYNLVATTRSATSLAAGFHVFGIEWSPGKIVFTLDGIPYATRTPASLPPGGEWVFDKPFYFILNLAVGGTFPGPPDATTPFPATMLVDWVRAYSSSH